MGKLNNIIIDVFEINDSEIKDDLKYQQIASWDSINHLNLVSEIEDAFNVEFDMDEIIAMEDIGKIKQILTKHGVPESELC